MFGRNTRKTFGQNIRKTPVRCKKYGTSADGYAIIKTKSVFVETRLFSINNKKCSGEIHAKHLGKIYAKRLYGAKNTVQVLTDMR